MSPKGGSAPIATTGAAANTLINTAAETAKYPGDFSHRSPGTVGSASAAAATRLQCGGRTGAYALDVVPCASCGLVHVHRPPADAVIYRRSMPCRPRRKYLIVVTATLPTAADVPDRGAAA